MIRETPNVEKLSSYFDYRDGKLYWKVDRGGTAKVGTEAGTYSPDGYVRVWVDGELFLAHRVIWKMLKGQDAAQRLDHIDRNKANNKIENLRETSHSLNILNSSAKGYFYCKKRKKFHARIGIGGKKVSIGFFNTEEEAASHYQEFKELYVEMASAYPLPA